jgi:uncharacterized membrane protein YccC
MLERLQNIHRDAWRDAARLGLQSGIAAALAYLAADFIGDLEPFLVIMMAVTALQHSVGGTIGQASIRFQSAVAGSVLGFLALLVVPAGWGTAAALGVALFAVGVAMALRSSWQLAVVPAVGMALEGKEDLVDTAIVTSSGILIGAAIGTAVSVLVWPERAEVRFERYFRRALKATATRLTDAIEATVEDGRTPHVDEHISAWNEAVWLAGEALGEAIFVDRDDMRQRLDALRELHDSVTILDRAAEAASPPLSVGVMHGQVGDLKRDACAVLTDLAGGRRQAQGRLRAMDETLARLRRAMEGEDVGPEEGELNAAVAFGLSEVRRTLAALWVATEGRYSGLPSI